MNWTEYLAAKKSLDIEEDPPALIMSGIAGDNATRYLLNQKGVEHNNDETLFEVVTAGSDFIWNGYRVRVHGPFGTGGHPALAGFGSVDCAGIIEAGWFFFHSGHFHPKLTNALYFFSNFVENTCATLHDGARDRKVDELSKIELKLYKDDSETETYSTTFAKLAARTTVHHQVATSARPSSSPITTGSSPISIGCKSGKDRTGFLPSSTVSKPHPDTEGSLFRELGINTYGRHQLRVRIGGAPVWIDDSSRTKCKECGKEFGTFRRKHHCRRCGDIVCDDCSKNKKHVTHPAVRPESKDPETQPVRVCDTCFHTQDLI